jgi:multisubunit Na+/H+ antiporter MnhB subunit
MEYFSYPLAIIILFLIYRIYKSRKKGRKWSELKVSVAGIVWLTILLWAINIYIGFYQS